MPLSGSAKRVSQQAMQVMRASKQEDIRKQSIILTKKMLFKADCFKIST